MKHWVFLADPGAYGWPELAREQRAVWDGIANAVAQRNLRACAEGDLVLIYHTAPDKAVQGIARVVRAAYADPADAGRVVVDIEPVRPLERTLSLAELKADEVLQQLSFVRMPRVAVQAVDDQQWQRVLEVSGTRA